MSVIVPPPTETTAAAPAVASVAASSAASSACRVGWWPRSTTRRTAYPPREPVRELRLDQSLQVCARPLDRGRVDEHDDVAVAPAARSRELLGHRVGHGVDDFRADGDAVEAQRHEPALGILGGERGAQRGQIGGVRKPVQVRRAQAGHR